MKIFLKDPALSFKEKIFSLLKDKKKAILVGLGLVFLSFLLIFFQKQRLKKLPSPTVSQVEQLSQDLVPKEQLPVENPAPRVFFGKYKLEAPFPSLPSNINLYTFKTNYSIQEAKEFAAKFGLFDFKLARENFIVASNLEDINNRGYLVFNKKTGGFSFQSFGIHKPLASPSDNAALVAENFLREKGLLDEAVSFHATYQRAGLSEVTFVEFHRSWKKAGLPILNIVGLLNLEEKIKLSELQLGMIDERMPVDEAIVSTSDNYNGKVRPNDFNTITVAVTSDGRIFSIASNLRPIEKSQILTSQTTTFLTPQQAFEEIKKGKGIFKLTIPSGAGMVDFTKVYPNNLAQAKEATVTDVVLTYLEKPPEIVQEYLQPIYIFKGYATLSSGYRVNWVQAAPIIQNLKISLSPSFLKKIAYALEDKTIELGTFTPTPSPPQPSPQVTPPEGVVPPAPPPTLPGRGFECDPSQMDLFEVKGLGTVGRVGYTFYYISSSDPAKDKTYEEIIKIFFDLVGDQYAINSAKVLNQDPSLIPANPSLETIYALFNKINFKSQYCQGTAAPPGQLCLNLEKETPSDNPFFIIMRDSICRNAGNQLIGAVNLGQVLALADEEDLFPKVNFPTSCGDLGLFFEYVPTSPHYGKCRYLTGSSPSLYLYPQRPTSLEIKVGSPADLTYLEPKTNHENSTWQVTAYPEGTLKGHFGQRERLYYEYLPIEFKEPKDGFVIERENLEKFLSQELFPQIGLNQKEAEDLLADVKTSLIGSEEKPYFKVSFIDPKELDQKLPLEVSRQPDKIYRIHLLLTSLDQLTTQKEPQIPFINRAGFVVLETGVVIQ